MHNGSSSYLDIAPEVAAAVAADSPVVALESTIISHGMPYPQNAETALAVESAVRENGALPATIAILHGRLKVGLNKKEINYLSDTTHVISKVSRRDIPAVLASDGDGSTTVAATMIIAALAGIQIFATGGIGGVHRGGQDTLDISADLEELAQTSVAVVCAGIKSVLDIPRTLEYLETKGVPVYGFGTDELPAFYCRTSGSPVDFRFDSPAAVARSLLAKWRCGIDGGVVIANPVPAAAALPATEIDQVIERALAAAEREGITGSEITPYLLQRITAETDGRSLQANIALVLHNAAVAAKRAVAVAAATRGELPRN